MFLASAGEDTVTKIPPLQGNASLLLVFNLGGQPFFIVLTPSVRSQPVELELEQIEAEDGGVSW